MSMPNILMWYGKKVDEMTRDELLVAFKQLAGSHHRDLLFRMNQDAQNVACMRGMSAAVNLPSP